MNEKLLNDLQRKARQFAVAESYQPDTLCAIGSDYFLGLQSAKFLELIVQECVSRISNTNLEDVDGGDSAVLSEAAKQVNAYFGVKGHEHRQT
jgi:hypothetical protein